MFLQNWRATLIPAIAVPVVLLGTFGVLAAVGYSINTLTLFALVLVIGLLVDDAIVVVENVERIMREEGLPPREATLKSMQEITGALIGIGLVLTAVFLPMAFFGGSTGVIYRQFSVTIVSAMALSIMVALVLTPVAVRHPAQAGGRRRPSQARPFLHVVQPQFRGLPRLVSPRRLLVPAPHLGDHDAYAAIIGVMALLFIRLPTGFLPDEDQGFIITQITLPAGAMQPRTLAVAKQVDQILQRDREEECGLRLHGGGFQLLGRRPEYRPGLHPSAATGTSARALRTAPSPWRSAPCGAFMGIRDAQIFRWCRRRCRNWASPPASTCYWRIAAISAMPR